MFFNIIENEVLPRWIFNTILGPGEKSDTADPVAAMLGTGGTGSADGTNVSLEQRTDQA